jgi:hypothetical protein
VREANLEYLLASPNRLAELLAENKQFLIIAHRRLAQGERCFVIEEEESVAAVGWASRRSPHSIREAAAALHVPGGAVVLYDFHQRSCGLYPQLLMGIRLGVGAEHALIYADDADAALLEAIHSAGFRSEGTVENRVVAGRRRVASRPSLTRALSWEITPEESSQRQTFLTIPQHSLDFLRFWRRIADTIARTVGL